MQAADAGEDALATRVAGVDRRGEDRIAVVEEALHRRPLGVVAQAFAPAAVVGELGQVAVGPERGQARDQRPGAAGVEIIETALDQLDRRRPRRHAQRRHLRLRRFGGRPAPSWRATSASDVDGVGRIEALAARAAMTASEAIWNSGANACHGAGSTHSATMRRSMRSCGAVAAAARPDRRARSPRAGQDVGVEHIELEREDVAGAERGRGRGPGNIHSSRAAWTVP